MRIRWIWDLYRGVARVADLLSSRDASGLTRAPADAYARAMLSESATRLDGLLRITRATALCADCAASALGVGKWDAMRLVRELILDGDVTCAVTDCSECTGRTLVARIRPTRWR